MCAIMCIQNTHFFYVILPEVYKLNYDDVVVAVAALMLILMMVLLLMM